MLQAPHSYLVVPLRQPPQAARRTPSPPYRAAPLPVPPAAQVPVQFLQQQHQQQQLAPVAVNKSKSDRSRSSIDAADVLAQGDIVAAGRYLNGELVREVSRRNDTPPDLDQPGTAFEVVRKLGTGSYAVVYHVRERLDRLPDSDDDASMSSSASSDDVLGALELHHRRQQQQQPKYGREFAIKCLSKANLGDEALQAQLQEATIHQSLPFHNNIVTLFRTLESDSLLLLLLELVPGEDLFYFLEQARDQQSDNDVSVLPAQDLSVTPPTPSLLSSFHPAQLLSHGRLRLIASMFGQMCDAVATCHAHGIAHRDIKPENFIVTDSWSTSADGSRERRVVVKLTDFGLATTDAESADMECGSAPYMSYECRNNLAPTYFPRPADVWSLGIVLINMLYHRNPWSDTSTSVRCSAFDLFREDPIDFFLLGFVGMTREIAEYLADSVFCILDSPDDTRRVAAHELGAWVKNLPSMMAPRRPSPPAAIVTQLIDDGDKKRTRKRGARKNKAAAAASAASLPSPEEDRLDHLASANQDLVRALSRMSTRSSATSSLGSSLLSAPPVPSLPASPQRKQSRWKGVFSLQKQSSVTSSSSSLPPPAPTPAPVRAPTPPPALIEEEEEARAPRQMSATVNNVSNLIMGLSAPVPDDRGRKRERSVEDATSDDLWSHAPSSASPSRVRNVSPLSSKSRPTALNPGSKSDNWRNSMMSSRTSVSTSTASSHYTRFSNGSTRSVSTANTSVSSAPSWRTSGTSASGNRPPVSRPAMVKDLTGIPWELHKAPQQLGPAPFRPVKKPATNSRGGLSTISEGRQQQQQQQQQPVAKHSPPMRSKLSVSTTSMDTSAADSSGSGSSPPLSPAGTPPSDSGPKKVNKGQINALAKMLSALKSR